MTRSSRKTSLALGREALFGGALVGCVVVLSLLAERGAGFATGLAGAVVLGLATAFLVQRTIFSPLARTLEAIETNRIDELEAGGLAAPWVHRITEAVRQHEVEVHTRVHPVVDHVQSLATSADGLGDLMFAMNGNAEQTSGKAQQISSHFDRVNTSVETVSSKMEELSTNFHQVASNARAGGEVGRNALDAVRNTDQSVARLGHSSAEIGNVVKLINSIAEQTNLLALNATIEAARAGEAGRGFAVVANEVRELATETAKATGDIGDRIATIQSDTEVAVGAIRNISEIVERINDIQSSIIDAVDEQATTVDVIQSNVQDAADAGVHIRANMAGLTTAAGSTAAGADETRSATDQFSKMTAELKGLVESLDGSAA